MQTPKKSFNTPPHFRLAKSTGSKSSPMVDDGGRFIPNRIASNLKQAFEKADRESDENIQNDERSQIYSGLVYNQLFGMNLENLDTQHKVFRYKPSVNASPENKENMPLFPMFQPQEIISESPRKLSKDPFKILDAPRLKDDFYNDVVDWSSLDLLAVGLESQVYIWNAASCKVSVLTDIQPDNVTSVNWDASGKHIAVGTDTGKLKIYDIQRASLVQDIPTQDSRIGTINWNLNVVTVGARDGFIIHRDVRSNEACSRFQAHRQEVCGIRWSPDGQYLASGGNDNRLMIWTPLSANPIGSLRGHQAAVKAIDWSPHQQGILASGGGTSDKTLRFWNTFTMEQLSCTDTNSQVCNMRFSKNSQELVTTHGFSQNQIIVWKYPHLQQVGVLTGHSSRVLYLSMSPNHENIVTGAGDETLRFWKLFPKHEENEQSSNLMILNVNNLR